MKHHRPLFNPALESLTTWLGEELEDRGIDRFYSRSILSLLQQEYVDVEPMESDQLKTNQFVEGEKYYAPAKSKLQKSKRCPKQLFSIAPCSRITSACDFEKIKKRNAIECMLSASDLAEDKECEDLINRVWVRLRDIKLDDKEDVPSNNVNTLPRKELFYICPSSPVEEIEKYCTAFPALNNNHSQPINTKIYSSRCSINEITTLGNSTFHPPPRISQPIIPYSSLKQIKKFHQAKKYVVCENATDVLPIEKQMCSILFKSLVLPFCNLVSISFELAGGDKIELSKGLLIIIFNKNLKWSESYEIWKKGSSLIKHISSLYRNASRNVFNDIRFYLAYTNELLACTSNGQNESHAQIVWMKSSDNVDPLPLTNFSVSSKSQNWFNKTIESSASNSTYEIENKAKISERVFENNLDKYCFKPEAFHEEVIAMGSDYCENEHNSFTLSGLSYSHVIDDGWFLHWGENYNFIAETWRNFQDPYEISNWKNEMYETDVYEELTKVFYEDLGLNVENSVESVECDLQQCEKNTDYLTFSDDSSSFGNETLPWSSSHFFCFDNYPCLPNYDPNITAYWEPANELNTIPENYIETGTWSVGTDGIEYPVILDNYPKCDDKEIFDKTDSCFKESNSLQVDEFCELPAISVNLDFPRHNQHCLNFIQGSCTNFSCDFSHDLSKVTCKFWKEGSCFKGLLCPFLHGYTLDNRKDKSQQYELKSRREFMIKESHGKKNLQKSNLKRRVCFDLEKDFPTLSASFEQHSEVKSKSCKQAQNESSRKNH